MPPVFDSWLQAWSRQALAVAARLRWPLNLGDCFAYALAIREETPILTLDEDFLRFDCPLIMPESGHRPNRLPVTPSS